MKIQRFLIPVVASAALGAIAMVLLRQAPKESPVVPPPPAEPTLVASHQELKSGAEILLAQGPCQGKIGLTLRFSVGFEHDPDGKSGMAFVIGRLLAGHSSDKSREVHVGRDFTLHTASFAATAFEKALGEWMKRVKSWAPSEEEVTRAKQEVVDEIALRHGGDARKTALSYAAESLRSSRSQGHLGGIREDVESITHEDVVVRWKDLYTPTHLRISLTGEVSDALVKTLSDELETDQRGQPVNDRAFGQSTVTGTLVMGSTPSVLALAIEPPPIDAPEFLGFLVLASRFKDSEKTGEILFEPLLRPDALFLIRSFGSEEQPDPLAAALRSEVEQLIEGPLTEEDKTRVTTLYADFLGTDDLAPSACAKAPARFSLARLQRHVLLKQPGETSRPLRELDPTQLDAARERFANNRTVAIAAGGEIR